MITIEKMVVNPFMENTFILYDETKQCIIIDPGFSNRQEEAKFLNFIAKYDLKPVHLINSHCHIDHILGNKFIHHQFNLELSAHKNEVSNITFSDEHAEFLGLPVAGSPPITKFLEEGDIIEFGNSSLAVLYTPGHTSGGISLYCLMHKFVIVGDLLFYGSIGRSDLPGGHHETLLKSVQEKIFTLPDNTVVYSGHGENTSVGFEKKNNPFFKPE